MKSDESRQFRPFTIVLADGGLVYVAHPEFLAHPGKGRTIVVVDRAEKVRIIDLLLVTSLEFERWAARNGRRRAG